MRRIIEKGTWVISNWAGQVVGLGVGAGVGGAVKVIKTALSESPK